VPVRETVEVPPVAALLLIVSVPVATAVLCGANVICKVIDWPTARVMGRVAGPSEKPTPVIAAELMVRAEVPDDVNVNDKVFVEPSLTFPKLRAVLLGVIPGVAAVPVPFRATVDALPVVQLLDKVKAPLTVPAVWGANVTGMARVCPGDRLAGRVGAPIENPVPVSEAEFNDAALLPEEVKVTVAVVVVPLVTFPKSRELVLSVSCRVAATPVPLRATVAVGFAMELLTIVNFPVIDPAALGENVRGNASVCPGDRVCGSVVEPIEKPDPLMERELIVRGAVPLEDKSTDEAVDVPTITLPKVMLAVLIDRFAVTAAVAGTTSQMLRLY
jgi:hypothetical protein